MATATQAPPKAIGSGVKSETDARVSTIRNLLQQSAKQIALALPKYMDADRMGRLAMTSFLRNPKLLECDPKSLVGAVIQCAQLGLEPGSPWGAHLVPFWNKHKGQTDVQVIADYRGLMGLCRNSEQISTIDAHPVYEKDQFEYRYGADPKLVHIPHPAKDRGEITHFYAVSRLKDGGFQFVVMMRWEVERVRDIYSKAASNGPWVTNFEEMGCKTCVRRLVDYLPARLDRGDSAMVAAAALEAKAEQGIPQDLGALLDTGDPEVEKALDAAKPVGAVQGLVDELREKQGAGDGTPPPGEDPGSPSAEEQAQIRAREQAEAGKAEPPQASAGGPGDRAALVKEIGEMQDARKMNAKDRVGVQRQFCGNETLDKAPIEALKKLADHLRIMTGGKLFA